MSTRSRSLSIPKVYRPRIVRAPTTRALSEGIHNPSCQQQVRSPTPSTVEVPATAEVFATAGALPTAEVLPIAEAFPIAEVLPTGPILVINDTWSQEELAEAYSYIIPSIEEGPPPHSLMRDIENPSHDHFALAAELTHYWLAGSSVSEAAAEQGIQDWLTERDFKAVMRWLADRVMALNLRIIRIEELPQVDITRVLNRTQVRGSSPVDLTGATPPPPPVLSKRTADVVMESPIRKRMRQESRSLSSSDGHGDDDYSRQSSSVEEIETPSPSSSPRVKKVPGWVQRTRWTSAQQLAMIRVLYDTGYTQPPQNWQEIAQVINAANTKGKAKTQSRVKSAMRETHWDNFVKSNVQNGTVSGALSWPDFTKGADNNVAWTGEQKRILWRSVFSYGEKAVNWGIVAEKVNAEVVDEALKRKAGDCEKTWRDTLRRNFGLQGRNARKR